MPEMIIVEATNRCNLNCKHCSKNICETGSAGCVDIDLRLLDRILEQTEPYRTRIVSITGGEPTLHSDWEGLIAVMERHDIDYTITSNGQNFKEAYKLIVQGASQRFRGFAFSLDGATAETNDAIRGEGSFAKVKEAFRLARMHGIPFSVQAVVGTYNVNELAQIAALADEAGALELNFTVMKPTLENVQYLLSPVQQDEVEKQMTSIREAHPRLQVSLAGNKSRYPLSVCRPLAMSMICIDYHGYLRFCPDLSNYRGEIAADSDIVDDLNTTPLQFALKELSNKINKFWYGKIDWAAEGISTSSDFDPCLYCVSHFNKYECMDL
jgi:MoaA/NifB/PqqE/SkfB family radical SAM enzyme